MACAPWGPQSQRSGEERAVHRRRHLLQGTHRWLLQDAPVAAVAAGGMRGPVPLLHPPHPPHPPPPLRPLDGCVGGSGGSTPVGSERTLRPLLPDQFGLLLQCEGDLGRRMLRATSDLLSLGHAGAILIGADAPTLPVAILRAAVDAL